MKWPWKSEKRNDSYTDALVSLLQQGAGGGTGAAASATGALEAASGLVQRCFQAAEISGPAHAVQALGPGTLGQIGRALIRQGEAVYFMDVQAGRLILLPAQSWDVFGAAHPDSWTYRLTLAGPDSVSYRGQSTGRRCASFPLRHRPSFKAPPGGCTPHKRITRRKAFS